MKVDARELQRDFLLYFKEIFNSVDAVEMAIASQAFVNMEVDGVKQKISLYQAESRDAFFTTGDINARACQQKKITFDMRFNDFFKAYKMNALSMREKLIIHAAIFEAQACVIMQYKPECERLSAAMITISTAIKEAHEGENQALEEQLKKEEQELLEQFFLIQQIHSTVVKQLDDAHLRLNRHMGYGLNVKFKRRIAELSQQFDEQIEAKYFLYDLKDYLTHKDWGVWFQWSKRANKETGQLEPTHVSGQLKEIEQAEIDQDWCAHKKRVLEIGREKSKQGLVSYLKSSSESNKYGEFFSYSDSEATEVLDAEFRQAKMRH